MFVPSYILLAIRQSSNPPPINDDGTSDDSDKSDSDNNDSTVVLSVTIVIVALTLLLIFGLALRSYRRLHPDPKYIPTKFLKERWVRWQPGYTYQQQAHHDQFEPLSEAATNTTRETRETIAVPSQTHQTVADRTSAGVDRNTSVRSVMTLPVYKEVPGHGEQILGRAGERGGIDVVLEFPDEAAQLEEEQREAEMNALYQVREARRNEASIRAEERRLRNEARERGDWVALTELQTRNRTNSAADAVDQARAERERIRAVSSERGRAVSSVSYADLGVIRHDGTRLRANSNDSERQGLLGDAASIAQSGYHSRQRSASSVLSIDTTGGSEGRSSPVMVRNQTRSPSGTPRRRGSNSGAEFSSPELIDAEHDSSDADLPTYSPPGYENVSLDDDNHPTTTTTETGRESPPDYTSPIQTRSPQLPSSTTEGAQPHRSDSANTTATARSGRGLAGAPHLPSLNLGNLPSIVVDSGTPIRRREDESRGTSPHTGA